MKRVGVFGGTFDPVHNGHLIIAREMMDALDLERVLFVLAARPPHKSAQPITENGHRLAMLQRALEHEPRFEVSDIELRRAGKSYTAETLEELAAQMAPASLVFLMGEDSLRDLPNWHAPDRIVAVAEIGVAARPGIQVDVASIYQQIPNAAGRIHLVETSEVPISSQQIRALVANGQSIAEFVPPQVEKYIRTNQLYLTTISAA